MPSSPFPDRFPDRLLGWWERFGRKNLPWQDPRSAYRVWVSEIMLQQTQVSAVIPYFERWMARFPDFENLAAAPGDDVLSLWSGLGYYARGRNLHRAARICVERHGGRLPDDAEALRALPGIGPSTANAILSLAFDRPAAVLDGNVKRLLARHAGIEGWPGDGKVQRLLWREAEARLPRERAADYSQAIMDLGALVCRKNRPRCEACPVRADCRALELGASDKIPAPRPGRRVPEKTVHMLVVRDRDGRVLLQRRPPTGIWGGLWSLPEGETRDEVLEGLPPPRIGDRDKVQALPDRAHRLSHLQLRIRPALLNLADGPAQPRELKDQPDRSWFDEAAWSGLGLPKPVRQILEGLE